MMKALVLINTKSRSGEEAKEKAVELLQQENIHCILPDDSSTDFSVLIAQYAGEIDVVIVGGGDGTLNRVANSVMEHRVTLGILPLGTANDMARTLGIPVDLDKACETVAGNFRKKINIGTANKKLFFNVANIGYGVEVNRHLTKSLKKRFGALSYLLAAIKACITHSTFTAKVVAGNRSIKVRALQIGVGNGRYYGGGMQVDDDARIEEDQLRVYVVRAVYLLKLVLKGKSFRDGHMERIQGVVKLHGQDFVIETGKPGTVMADGEILTKTPVVFGMIRDAVEVIVPRPQGKHDDSA